MPHFFWRRGAAVQEIEARAGGLGGPAEVLAVVPVTSQVAVKALQVGDLRGERSALCCCAGRRARISRVRLKPRLKSSLPPSAGGLQGLCPTSVVGERQFRQAREGDAVGVLVGVVRVAW